jgi:hypothetical protein
MNPHTFLHSQNMRCDSRASLLACTIASPCLGCEPKVRVVTHKKLLQLFQECHNHCRKNRKEFIYVYCHYKNSKMKINEHQKKGCDKVVDFKMKPFKFKLYPPLINIAKNVRQIPCIEQ